MSFIHAYLVGHFDLYAFFGAAPAVLKPVDEERARRLLSSMGRPLTEEQRATAFTFVNGYVECTRSALGRRSAVAEQFATSLAETEGCVAVDMPGMIVYPPSANSRLNNRDGSLTPETAERILADGELGELRRAVWCAAMSPQGTSWVESFCSQLARHVHFNVRGNAMYAFGRLGTRGHGLDRSRVQPLIESGLADSHPYVRRQADSAARAIEISLGWLFPDFDSGKPEMDVSLYGNGWVRCPQCGWRFATYDPRAFCEGRCMTCRQRLRIRQPTGKVL